MIPGIRRRRMAIPVAVLAGWAQDLLANHLSLIMMIIIIITALASIIAKIAGKEVLAKTPFFQNLFYTNGFWLTTRILAAVFAVMVYFQLRRKLLPWHNTYRQLLLDSLLHVFIAILLLCQNMLPL